MSRVDDLIAGTSAAIVSALAAADDVSVPVDSPVLNGWPNVARTLLPVTNGGGYVVGIVPVEPSRRVKKRMPARIFVGAPTSELTVNVSGNSITLGGTPTPGIIMHFIAGALSGAPPAADAYANFVTGTLAYDVPLVVASGETLEAFAQRAATQIATTVPGCEAICEGHTILFSGVAAVVARVVATANGIRRVSQIDQRLQMTIWSRDGALRSNVADAIVAAIGTDDPVGRWMPLGDGTYAWIRYVSGPRRKDEPTEMASLKRADIFFDAQYDVVRGTTLSTVAIIPVQLAASGTTTSAIIGGPRHATHGHARNSPDSRWP